MSKYDVSTDEDHVFSDIHAGIFDFCANISSPSLERCCTFLHTSKATQGRQYRYADLDHKYITDPTTLRYARTLTARVVAVSLMQVLSTIIKVIVLRALVHFTLRAIYFIAAVWWWFQPRANIRPILNDHMRLADNAFHHLLQ